MYSGASRPVWNGQVSVDDSKNQRHMRHHGERTTSDYGGAGLHLTSRNQDSLNSLTLALILTQIINRYKLCILKMKVVEQNITDSVIIFICEVYSCRQVTDDTVVTVCASARTWCLLIHECYPEFPLTHERFISMQSGTH